MSFLSPAAIAIAAGLTIPPLIALYFLKLKRQVRLVPTTLLWKRAIEDLHVNAPFQRLRASLLLLLQLLVLALAALALGQPMFATAERHKDNLILLVDQSASMNVVEPDGRSRLDRAKEQARRTIDNMDRSARAMVIAFNDRATVIAPFSTDREDLKRQIDAIPQTDSTSTLSEAISLAEAYAEDMVMGGESSGTDLPPERMESPATVFLFTDGNIEDAETVALQEFDLSRISITNVGERGDNVGILAMGARRNYDRPQWLEVAATVRNFGPGPVEFDATLYVEGQNVDIKSVRLGPGAGQDPAAAASPDPPEGSVTVVAFDDIEYEGGGVIEVQLRLDDALPADDRAWTVIDPPRDIQVLLVHDGNWLLQSVLQVFSLELTEMTPAQYEAAPEEDISDGRRSRFDVVIFDRHPTGRLPQGNYFFWGAVPQIEGVSAGRVISDELIFNWDDTHPVLRHSAIETLQVFEWLNLVLPPEAVTIIEGQTSPVLAYFTREGSQYLISAFSLVVADEFGKLLANTYWAGTADYVMFMQNAVQYLGANVATTGDRAVRPGRPVTLPVPARADHVNISRPDAIVDRVPAAGYQSIHYARTRKAGVYRIEPGLPGSDVFAVNLYDENESDVAPRQTVMLGAEPVKAATATVEISEPAWRYFLLALLLFVLLEWIVYNRRILV